MTTDYNKTDRLSPTTRKLIEYNSRKTAFAQTTIPTNIHTANRIFTNIILMADKHNIPKGKMHNNCMLLPEDIVCKITQTNNIRREKPCDLALKLLKVCSAVTVECCVLYPCCMGVFGMFALLMLFLCVILHTMSCCCCSP